MAGNQILWTSLYVCTSLLPASKIMITSPALLQQDIRTRIGFTQTRRDKGATSITDTTDETGYLKMHNLTAWPSLYGIKSDPVCWCFSSLVRGQGAQLALNARFVCVRQNWCYLSFRCASFTHAIIKKQINTEQVQRIQRLYQLATGGRSRSTAFKAVHCLP